MPFPRNRLRAELDKYHHRVGVARVWVTADQRWRVELRDDGHYELRMHGSLVLSQATLDRVAARLAEEGVGPDDLLET